MIAFSGQKSDPFSKFLLRWYRSIVLYSVSESSERAQRARVLERRKTQFGAISSGRLVREHVLATDIRMSVRAFTRSFEKVGVQVDRKVVFDRPKYDRWWYGERCAEIQRL